jgi:hypothetical protein
MYASRWCSVNAVDLVQKVPESNLGFLISLFFDVALTFQANAGILGLFSFK